MKKRRTLGEGGGCNKYHFFSSSKTKGETKKEKRKWKKDVRKSLQGKAGGFSVPWKV